MRLHFIQRPRELFRLLLLSMLLPFLLNSALATIPGNSFTRHRRNIPAARAPRKARDSALEYRVIEKAKHGVLIGEPLSRTLDNYAPNMRFRFSTRNHFFGINETSGQLRVKSQIDRENLCQYFRTCCPESNVNEECYIPVRISVLVNRQPVRITKVRVYIKDINDERPLFPVTTRRISLGEDAPVGTVIAVSEANDRDSSENAVVRYELKQCDSKVFNLSFSRVPDSRKGFEVRLILNKKLDHETRTQYVCRLIAHDGKHEEAMDIKLTVKDVNDHKPEWSRTNFKIKVPEDQPRYSEIYKLKATDKDEDFGEISYKFGTTLSNVGFGPFALNSKTGAISLDEELNYDQNGKTLYKIPVIASDNGRPVPFSVTSTLTVIVTDVNDNAPIITARDTRLDIEENSPPKYLTHIEVSDPDSGENKKVSCTLENYNHFFNITKIFEGSYNFYLTAPIDREHAQIPRNGFLKVPIMCTDAGKTPKTTSDDIIVNIVDVNDHAPRFERSHYVARLVEDQPAGTPFLTVHATDADHSKNAELEYSLIADPQFSNQLTVDGNSGSISSADRFDREQKDKYEFQVMVKDRGTPPLNDTANVTLIISDINDNSPKFPPTDAHQFKISESAPVGTILGRINATDPDLGDNGTVVFSQERKQYNLPFVVHNDGQVELIRTLDREKVADYSLTVTAHDQGANPKFSSTTLTINVLDENDSGPIFEKMPPLINISCDNADGDQFHYATFIKAHDPDLRSNVTYSISKQNNKFHKFRIDESSGRLSVQSTPGKCRSTSFSIVVIATDKDKPRFSKSKRFRVVVQGYTNHQGILGKGGYGTKDENTASRYDPNDEVSGNIGRDELDVNLIIIIILVCTAIVLTFVMLFAALYLRKRQLRAAREYEKGRREMPDGDTFRRDKERHYGPPGSLYAASLPSSPRKEFEHIKKSNMSLEDVYHEHEMDTKASRLKLEGSSTKLKPTQYGNDIDETGVPLNPQMSHESAHTYQSMSSHNKESPENAGYTVFQHELFSYIPDTLRSANVDSKRKNKTSQVTISFV